MKLLQSKKPQQKKPQLLKPHNELIVRVKDETDTNSLSRGKQKIERGGIWYTPQSGIYFPVFIESVSNDYIKDIKITPRSKKEEETLKATNMFTILMSVAHTYEMYTVYNKELDIPILFIHDLDDDIWFDTLGIVCKWYK